MFAGSMEALKELNFFRHVKWKFGFWKRMGVPSPDYFPYIGTMKEIKKQVMYYMYRERGSFENNYFNPFNASFFSSVTELKRLPWLLRCNESIVFSLYLNISRSLFFSGNLWVWQILNYKVWENCWVSEYFLNENFSSVIAIRKHK